MARTLFILCTFASVLLLCRSNPTARISTVYDVLQLVYQVCATDERLREDRLACVSTHMGKEVVNVLDRCMTERQDRESNDSSLAVKEFCEQLTHVPEWASKHDGPPQQLTRIMGLAALGRMACVLGEVQRPLPMWQAAFAKCFPEYQSTVALRKDSVKNKSANALDDASD